MPPWGKRSPALKNQIIQKRNPQRQGKGYKQMMGRSDS